VSRERVEPPGGETVPIDTPGEGGLARDIVGQGAERFAAVTVEEPREVHFESFVWRVVVERGVSGKRITGVIGIRKPSPTSRVQGCRMEQGGEDSVERVDQ